MFIKTGDRPPRLNYKFKRQAMTKISLTLSKIIDIKYKQEYVC